jgi:hypothetical protein
MMADALSMILELAREVVQIKGLVDHLIPGVVSHLSMQITL